MYKNVIYSLAVITVSIIGAPLNVLASDDVSARISRLEEENEELRAMVRQLLEGQKQLETKLSEVDVQHYDTDTNAADSAGIKFGPGLRVKSADGASRFEVRGTIQADAAFFDDDQQDYPDGTDFRRVRLGVRGAFLEDWDYRVEADYAFNDVRLINTYLRYHPVEKQVLTFGQHKPPLSIDFNTSFRHRAFVERAAASDVFAPNHRIGVGYAMHDDRWNFAVGAFGESSGAQRDDDEGYLFSARATVVPYAQGGDLLHVGLGAHYRTPDDSDELRFRARPESRLSNNVFIVDTGVIDDVDDVVTSGVELAGQFGPVNFQGEYLRADVRRKNDVGDLSFDGWYVQSGWMITGEQKSYSASSATFGGVSPAKPFSKQGGIGAWEIALRYGELDLTDDTVLGGETTLFTAGLNWYPNAFVRMSGNYIIADSDEDAVAPDDEPEVFILRTQVGF